jgi:hypothetical protein
VESNGQGLGVYIYRLRQNGFDSARHFASGAVGVYQRFRPLEYFGTVARAH